ncbi:tetratricopeptide repeat protein [Spirochaeta dissipatitropha]
MIQNPELQAACFASRKAVFPVLLLLLGSILLLPLAAQVQPGDDALVEYRRGEYGRAIEITLAEIEQDPARLDAYVVLGWSLLAQNRFEEARNWAEPALQLRRWDPRVLHILGESHFRLGNYEQAIQYLQEYIAVNPSGGLRAQIYANLGESLYRSGEYHHADIALSTAVTYVSGNVQWWLLLAQIREEAGNYSMAEQAYRRVLELRPASEEASIGLTRLAEKRNQ